MRNTRQIVTILLCLALLALVACEPQPTTTPTATPPPESPTAEVIVEETTTPTAAADTPTEIDTPAAEDTPVPSPTPTGPTAVGPTPTAAVDTPKPLPTPSPVAPTPADPTPVEPTPADPDPVAPAPETRPGTLATGQSDTATLATGESRAYTFLAVAFEPVLAFVETDFVLDVTLEVHSGPTPSGAPLQRVNANAAGGPEIMVFVPNSSGHYSLVVRANETAVRDAGEYTVYLFDMNTPSPDVDIQITDSLAAGETKSYTAQSTGSRPLLAWLDPVGFEPDLVIQAVDEAGAVIAEANFGGPGSVESVYVIPAQTASYTIRVFELNNAPATYRFMVMTLDEQQLAALADVEPAMFATGQREAASLATGQSNVHHYRGAPFQPVLVFVESDDTLDVALEAYAGRVLAEAMPEHTPLARVDGSQAGGPEIMTFIPGIDGHFTLAVRANEAVVGQAGDYRLYLFDTSAPAANVPVLQTDSAAAGETRTYAVQSVGARPVLVWVNPHGQGDVVIRINDEAGATLADVNLQSGGFPEVAYVLPVAMTTYNIHISGTGGAAVTYDVMIVTLD